MDKSALDNQSRDLKEMLDHISDGVVIVDKNWCYTYMNKKAGELVKRDPGKIIGKNIWEEFPDLVGQSFYLAYQKAMKNQEFVSLKEYYPHYDKWFENHIYPSSDGITIYFRDITEQEKNENLIKQLYENGALINNTSDLLWSVNNDYTLIAANNAFIKALEENGGFLIKPGDNILSSEYFPDDYLAYWKGFYSKALSGEAVLTEVYTPQAESTELLWFELKIDPIKEGEKITGIACSMRNITERKKAEQALVESERFLQTLISNLPGYYYRVKNNADYTPEYISIGVYSITGYEAKEYLIDRTISYRKEIIPEDQDWVREKVQKAISQKKGYELSYRINTKSGMEKWVWEHGKAVWNQHGEMEALEGFVTEITAQKEIEKSLKESEEKYRTLVQQSADAIFLVDTEGNYLEANESASLITGYSIDELKKMNARDLVEPEDLKKKPLKTEEIKTGQKIFLERVIKRKDATLADVEITAKLMDNANVIVSLRDVTDRKKAEKELSESDNRLRTILETEPECVKILNEKGEVVDMNRAGLLMIEADNLEVIIGKSVISIVDTPYKEAFTNLTKKIFKGESGTLEFEITGLKGTKRWLETHAVPFKNSNGIIISLLGITRDITVRKITEQKIIKSEKKYRNLVEQASDGIMQIDEEGKITLVNNSICEMLGYTEEELLKLRVEDTYPETDKHLAWQRRKEATEKGAISFDRLMVRKDGTEITVDISISKIENGQLLGIIRDISARKIAEEKIANLNSELEQRVKERTAELETLNAELVEINDLFVGREAWIIDLKEELEALKSKVNNN